MISSMTGFARIEGRVGDISWVWELRSVNGRNLDIRVRAPGFVEQVERVLREAIAAQIKRGSIQGLLTVERADSISRPHVNFDVLQGLISDLSEIELPNGAPIHPARLDGLLQIRGVLESSGAADSDEVMRTAPLGDIPSLVDDLAKSRADEGRRVATVLEEILSKTLDLVTKAKSLAASQPEQVAGRYKETLIRLMGDAVSVPEERIVQEAAALAVKIDVTEELDRLTAHVAHARELIAAGGPVGRRLDFLSQEFNREANTLSSKSADLSLTRVAMDLKTAIDAFREQVQNIE